MRIPIVTRRPVSVGPQAALVPHHARHRHRRDGDLRHGDPAADHAADAHAGHAGALGPDRRDDHPQDRRGVLDPRAGTGSRTSAGISAVAGSISRPMNLPPNFYGRDSGVSSLTLVGVDPVAAPTPARLHDHGGPLPEAGRRQRGRDPHEPGRSARAEAGRHAAHADHRGRGQAGRSSACCRAGRWPAARRCS